MQARTAIERIRRNHALEHATVALLLERGGKLPIGGYSLPSGFVIWARCEPETAIAAASDALELLNDGYGELAISPYCGTNFAASVALGIGAAYIAGRGRGFWPKLRGAAVGFAVASAFGRPVGRLVQKRLTVRADVEGAEIAAVRTLRDAPLAVVWVGVDHKGAAQPGVGDFDAEAQRREGWARNNRLPHP